MKILTICDQGNNRSVQFAHLLKYKYKGFDVIPIGLSTTSLPTLQMLFEWANIIILTEPCQKEQIPFCYEHKVKVWDVGADTYPRPFNKELYAKARAIIEQNPL